MTENNSNNNINRPRKGCKDVWNASLVKNASFGRFDIPYCPTTAKSIPDKQITWEEAKQIHRKHLVKKNMTIMKMHL